MINIFLYSILFIEILFAISTTITFKDKVKDAYAAKRQLIISGSFSIQGFAYIAMLLSSSDVLSYFLYAVSWYAGVVLLANLVTMAAYSINYQSDFVKYVVSVIYYLGIIIYFIDTYISKGSLVFDSVGVSYPTFSTLQIVLHALYYAIFISAIARIFSDFSIQQRIKRERYLLTLWAITFSFTIVGVLFEFVELLFNKFSIPFLLMSCIGTILFMPKLLIYHRSIVMCQEDYSEYLRSDNTDIVFVCDDEYNIKYLNKRALIAGQVIKESFENRNISDIYLISPDVENTLYDISEPGIITVPAVYSPLNRSINLEVRPIFDQFNELFASVITVSGMDNQEVNTAPIDNKDKLTDDKPKQDSNTEEYSIAGSRILIINENSIRLNVFEKMLQPYSFVVNHAVNVHVAYREIIDHTYDMIFIDENISSISPYDFVRKIRVLDDDYYKMVPICFCTDKPMDDQYKEFMDAGFSEYLLKPISAKQLDLVLSRWLWKRYNKEYVGNPDLISPDSDTKDLRLLLEDCNMYYEMKNSLLLANCLRAICRQCINLNLPEYEYDARSLYKAVILDDLVYFEKQYNNFQSAFIKAVDEISLNNIN